MDKTLNILFTDKMLMTKNGLIESKTDNGIPCLGASNYCAQIN